MIWKRLWNLVITEISRARHYCLSCGKKMKRIPAVEEKYVFVSRTRPAGNQRLSSYGSVVPKSGERRIEVTPVYDVCRDCDQRIRSGSIKKRVFG